MLDAECARDGTAGKARGGRAAAFLRGRLMMHGASAGTPVTAVENASLTTQRLIPTTLLDLPRALEDATPGAPVLLLFGLAPRAAALALADMKEAL